MKIIPNVLSNSLFEDCIAHYERMIEEPVWTSSIQNWKPSLNQGLVGSVLYASVPGEILQRIEEETKHYFPGGKIECVYQIWQPLSGVGVHNDGHKKFGATIYLNEEWDRNAGGWFIWEDEETREYRAYLPVKNSMIVNDRFEYHQVTPVAAQYGADRVTIQVWAN